MTELLMSFAFNNLTVIPVVLGLNPTQGIMYNITHYGPVLI